MVKCYLRKIDPRRYGTCRLPKPRCGRTASNTSASCGWDCFKYFGKLFVLTAGSCACSPLATAQPSALRNAQASLGKMQVRRESFMRLDCFKYFSLALK